MEQIDFRPVLLAWAALQAEELGSKKCSRKGVGGLIRKLKLHMEAGLPDMYGASARRACSLLEAHCRLCGKCDQARIMRPSREENRSAN